MELIPILSTIILVATISTFILAIGAYILYKVRERKGQAAVAKQPAEVKGELITPTGSPAQKTAEQIRAVPQPIYVEPQATPSYQRQPIIIQQQAPQQPRFSPKPQPYTAYRQPYSTTSVGQQKQYAGAGKAYPQQQQEFSGEKSRPRDSKFLQYTSEGYVPAKEEMEPGELRWR